MTSEWLLFDLGILALIVCLLMLYSELRLFINDLRRAEERARAKLRSMHPYQPEFDRAFERDDL